MAFNPAADTPATFEDLTALWHYVWGRDREAGYPGAKKADFNRGLEFLQRQSPARPATSGNCPGCGRCIFRHGEVVGTNSIGEVVKRCPCGRVRMGTQWQPAA